MVTMLVVLIFLCTFFATAFIVAKLGKISAIHEFMSPPSSASCIELTANQYILFHELYPKNFLLKRTPGHKYLIYISDKSYEEFEKKKKQQYTNISVYMSSSEQNYEYIKLKTSRDYDKVDKYFKNKKEQEERAKQCAVQAEFLKDMKAKTAQEVEKASKTIKTAEDVFKTILNQTEKS